MNSGGASPPRAAAKIKRETGGAVTASSPLPFHAGGEEIYHLQQKENAQTAMGFVFLDLSGSNSFSLLCLFSFCQ
jgi:hypothetical protein